MDSVADVQLGTYWIFGWIMNLWTALSYIGEISFSAFIGLYISSFPMDTIHSAATVIFLVVLYDPWTKKLRRLYNKVNKLKMAQ